ncbi:cytochrome c [Hoeflea poritis]|uniref:Cytochrome c n=1 Tax=Hoeflea poritis TaxID=2993659 RepID=A0ABT4VTX4_9HYPH|nr:cytochrome c [Hoeflea poritis]MDA4848164.1 cytochrome c [Hoeflea poritis]
MRRLFGLLVLIAVAAAVVLWFLSAPGKLDEADFAGLAEPDLARGEEMFWAGGCASCHAAPGAKGDDKLLLSGGLAIESDFGTFHAPNISPDKDAGIGNWTFRQFANAMKKGTSPQGTHLYPSFPYTSYTRMTMSDLNDMWGYLQTLPASDNVAPDHALGFPFNIRRAVGLWNLLYLRDGPVIVFDSPDDAVSRGQYLVEGPGHCGECHTPRSPIGGLEFGEWMAGATNPDGEGIIPNITPDGSIKSWSAGDIAYYLESGFTPDFDTAGGSMVSVQENMARLPASDREAIAAYLKAIPGRPNGYPARGG